MYIPTLFKADELETLQAFMQAYNFVTLITNDNGTPFATHLPILLDKQHGPYGTLTAHMARANPQWRHFTTAQTVLVIFQGPHTYISPSWYTNEFNVPTWNYTAVHAYGSPRIIEDQTMIQRHLDELVQYQEAAMPQPWTFTWSDRHVNLTKAIVAFDIEITTLEGKFKLNQNRTPEDQQGVISALSHSSSEAGRAVAEMMVTHLPTKTIH